MAIFIFKIIAIVVRTIAKPLISWASYYKRMKLQEPDSKLHYLRDRVVWVGQITNYYNTKINRKLFKLPSTDPIKNLPDDKAIEKGAEFISELIIYSVLLSLPIFEWWRQSGQNKIKDEIKESGIRRMGNDLSYIIEENNKLKKDLTEIKVILNKINNKI